jgi:tetratricopeptide (TPR) repeat protein
MNDKRDSTATMSYAPIDDRYQIEKVLGQGGMAVVYQVCDTNTGKVLALKQLLSKETGTEQKEIAELFEHEFHILAQLAHPGVIEVYNFGHNGPLPYYTMELLDGGDIREMAPIPWKKACSLFFDVCSALGLLHSRRQLHRDLSPRNVRCTRDLKAKLIDFGGMGPMGPCKRVMGTPAFTSPEVIGLQTIDARSDLYSLGATLYYALTGRYAFRAGEFTELRDAWRSKPAPPSRFIAEIPTALDNLVLSLIHLDLMARPVNAAEVMERLSAIANLDFDEKLLASRAYLSKPMLVARDEQLGPVRRRMMEALGGKGGAIFIEGAAGVGRSRFLDTCVLEGQLAGATILRADASDAYAGDWGAVQILASQLLDLMPEVALETAKAHISLLGHVLPELLGRFEASRSTEIPTAHHPKRIDVSEKSGSGFDRSAEVWGRGLSSRPPAPSKTTKVQLQSFANQQELRPRVQAALRDWLLEISERHCLLIAVDDIHRIDEPSAAFFTLLSQEISDRRVAVALTAETNAPAISAVAIKLIKQSAVNIKLHNLNLKQTEQLLKSIFGETPNQRIIADKLQAISRGNLRTVIQLTQHLLDKGVIRHVAGAWMLPSSIDAGDLPSSLNDVFKARVGKLSENARGLAQTMALSSEQRFSYEECQRLTYHQDTARLIQNLDELVTEELLATDGTNYWLSQPGWVSILTEGIEPEKLRASHLRVGEVLEKRGSSQFRVGQHLLSAGQNERALDILTRFSETSRALTSKDPGAYPDLIRSIPRNWFDTLSSAIQLAKKTGRPRKEIYILQSRLIGLLPLAGCSDTTHFTELYQQIYRASPLPDFQELGDSMPAQERLGRAFKLAQQRYESTPESERLLTPVEAVSELAKALIIAVGMIYISDNYTFWKSLPSIKPLMGISPAIEVVQKSFEGHGDGVMGRLEQIYLKDLEILARLDQPDKAKLEGAHHQYLRYGTVHAIGIIESQMGKDSSLGWVAQVETSPLLQINAWRMRKIYHLWQGAASEAEKCQQKIELLQIQNSPTQSWAGTNLSPELRAYACTDDLSGIKQLMNDIEKMAAEYPSWLPTLHYARGEYQRIRGDHSRALKELQKGLKLCAAGQHPNWPFLAGAYINTLNALGRYQEAVVEGRELLKAAQQERLSFICNYLRMPLAVAEAEQGHHEDAVTMAQVVIDTFKAQDATGINLGLAYETRAVVAALMNDRGNFQSYAKLCAERYQTGGNPALSAKYEKLVRKARQSKLGGPADAAHLGVADGTDGTALNQVATMLASCAGPQARAARALEILIKQTHCIRGFLYTVPKDEPVLSAQVGTQGPSVEIETTVRDRFAKEIDATKDLTLDSEQEDNGSVNTAGEEHHCIVLGHATREGFALTGLAFLLTDPNTAYNYPAKTVAIVSRALLESGDVARVYAAEDRLEDGFHAT